MKTNLFSYLIFATLLMFSHKSLAQPCIYLAYDYCGAAANTPMNGGQSGSNWATNWDVQNGNTAIPGYQYVNGSLSYSNLQTAGNHIEGGSIYLMAGRRLNTTQNGPFANLVTQWNDAIGAVTNGDVLWFSVMLRKDQNNGESVAAYLHDNNLPWCQSCSANALAVGYFGSASDVGGVKKWSLRLGSTVYPTSESVVASQTAFFVVKMTFNAGQTAVDVYVNPTTLGATTPTNPTISHTTASPLGIRSVAAYLGSAANNGSIDEIRFGTTYSCVAPDNTTAVNLPPTASFTASVITGLAPLAVNFNGTASNDPENQIVSYTWDFGDGSLQASGANLTTTNHTYTALGQLAATLTITDNTGQAHTATQMITVSNSAGTFPCLSSATNRQEAHCGQSDGAIEIHLPPNVSTPTLQNSSGQNIAASAGNANIYDNLAVGNYHLYVSGQNGCKDTLSLYVHTDSSTCTGWQVSDCAMKIGVNPSGLADWGFERPFRNLFKHVRDDVISFEDNCNCWDSQVGVEILIDTAGYPLQIPQTTSAGSSKFRFVISAGGGNLQDGKEYVLLYDGAGSITLSGGATIVSQTPGRIQFIVNGIGNYWLDVNASTLGNHLRNFRLLRLADEFTNLTATPFYQTFLDRIAPFAALRYMDWGATNASPNTVWTDRKKPSYRTYSGANGVPYEKMIELGNVAKKDVWICVPHRADDNYITQMAVLFRDKLDPKLTIYLEYSNEVWNWMFEQAHYNDDNRPSNLTYARAYAERATHVFEIWTTVFGNQKFRIKRTLGMQAGYNALNEQILSQLTERDWDCASPTFYIGLDHGSTGNPVLNAASTPLDVIANARNSYYNFKTYLKQDYRNVHLYGKEIVNYEGGQHFTDFSQPPYLQAMYNAQVIPEMYHLYDELLDSVRLWGSKLAMAFVLAGQRENIYGSWGHLEDIDQQAPFLTTAPKYQALLDNMPPANCNSVAIAPAQSSLFSIYPNPTSQDIHITSTALKKGGTLILYDILGRKIQEIRVELGTQEITLTLDKNIPSGIYHLTFEGELVGKIWLKKE
jgi:PKD repeat protein